MPEEASPTQEPQATLAWSNTSNHWHFAHVKRVFRGNFLLKKFQFLIIYVT
jgi:hypothetical protein